MNTITSSMVHNAINMKAEPNNPLFYHGFNSSVSLRAQNFYSIVRNAQGYIATHELQ